MSEKEPACIFCAKRDACMPYDDETLIDGLAGGHVPAVGECGIFVHGDESTREKALKELDDFDAYAKNLIKTFANMDDWG